jgi:hypothetical protein
MNLNLRNLICDYFIVYILKLSYQLECINVLRGIYRLSVYQLDKFEVHIIWSEQMIKSLSKDIRNIQHRNQNLNNRVCSSVNYGIVSR